MPELDKLVLSYFAKAVEAQVSNEGEFIDVKKPSSGIGFMVRFKFALGKNRIGEGVAMKILVHFANETLTNALYSNMSADDKFTPTIISARNKVSGMRKLLLSYSKVVG